MKIAIAGAGLLGRLLAWRLARVGHQVTVADAADGPLPSRERAAAFTAAGMLSPVAELDSGGPRVAALGWRSLALWPQWLAELDEPVPWQQNGSLLLAHAGDRPAAQRLLGRLAAQGQVSPPELDRAGLQALEPALSPGLVGWLLKGEGCIHPLRALAGLFAAGCAAGVQWRWGQRVGLLAPGRLGEERFDHVIDVRGVGAAPDLPVRGVRGEVFWLHAPGVELNRPLRLLHPRLRVYLVPREGEQIVVGASEVESEDRSPVSLRSTFELLGAAASVIPELAEARLIHSETNLRPALPDNLPLIERHAGLTRLNGLFRHGWLVAPALIEEAWPAWN
jgi:glycine oxidase